MSLQCANFPKGCLGALWILLVILEPAYALSIVYVDVNASGADNGISWDDAYNSLQDALAHAATSPKPMEIRVAQGVYRPDQGRSAVKGDRNSVFKMIDQVSIRGGFAGVRGPDPNARDFDLHKSILSGDLAGNDVWNDAAGVLPAEVPPMCSDNSRCIVDASLTDRTASLDGFCIEGAVYVRPQTGRGEKYWPTVSAGGLYVNAGAPTIRDCVFTHNFASGTIGVNARGAAFFGCAFVFNRSSEGAAILNGLGNLVMSGCVFANNAAESGGAIWNKGGLLVLDGSEFRDNAAEKGGAFNTTGGTIILTQCEFRRNMAGPPRLGFIPQGGAVCSDGSADLTIVKCSFSDNVSSGEGGGLCIEAVYATEGTLTVRDCRFSSNRAEAYGGGIFWMNRAAGASITGSVFIANQAWSGGAIDCYTNPHISSGSGNSAIGRIADMG